VKLSFKFKPKLTELQLNIIEELSFHTTKLYNIVNYDCRENGFKSYIETEKEYKANYDKSRRIVRGLFRSNKGILVNSDVNGSLNILRKYVKDKCIPKLIQSVMDNGGLSTPLRIRVA